MCEIKNIRDKSSKLYYLLIIIIVIIQDTRIINLFIDVINWSKYSKVFINGVTEFKGVFIQMTVIL